MGGHISEIEFQCVHPNGDIDFVTVYDLTNQAAFKWILMKYPDCEISLVPTFPDPGELLPS